MAVSPEDLAAGALALQVFVKNAKNVEIIVNVAFAAIPTVLGLGAAGLLSSGLINTAKEVRNSISLLKTVGPMAGLGLAAGKGLNKGRIWAGQKFPSLTRLPVVGGLFKPPKKKRGENQDTQDKQEGQRSGGSGGSPPPPPDIKPTQDKQEGQGSEGSKIILPEDLLKSGKISLEEYLKLQKKLEK